MSDDVAFARLLAQVTQRWPSKDEPRLAGLGDVLGGALASAREATPEWVTVAGTTSRPRKLRLAALCTDRLLDAMYQQEWAELAVADDGVLYLVYRRRSGEHDCLPWSPASVLPQTLLDELPEPLAAALLDG